MSFRPESIVKTIGDSRFEFYPDGSRYTLHLGGYPILIEAVRGGNPSKRVRSHPCSPNFDEDTAGLGLPRHGLMRDALITEILVDSHDTLRTKFALEADGYPKGVVAEQNFRLTETYLEITTAHRNLGEIPAPVNYGDHFYFNAPKGNEGVQLGKNRRPLIYAIKHDLALSYEHEQLLHIPGLPELLLYAYKRKVINPWVDTNADGEHDTNYFALSLVEEYYKPRRSEGRNVPASFGTASSMIKPGEWRTSTAFIALAA